jgi:hypothetical protein
MPLFSPADKWVEIFRGGEARNGPQAARSLRHLKLPFRDDLK